jgi:phage baseplate assembly protein W
MDIAFPYRIDDRGRTAEAGPDDHVRQLLEQVLFTAPGERVNRPTFGSGLLQLVFAPNSPELAAAVQFLAQGALQQFLGDVIQVQAVEADSADATLQVTVRYMVRRTQEQQTAQLSREV